MYNFIEYRELTSNFSWSVEKCLSLILNLYCMLLGMTTLMPLLETVDLLVTFAQKRDVYVCDFVVALKIAEGQLYTLYVDKATSYGIDEFWALKNIIDCSYSQMYLSWISDLNNDSAGVCCKWEEDLGSA